ncbi:MAG: hypothetical protein ACYSOF_06110, partial [Planctomycetota bacterium]
SNAFYAQKLQESGLNFDTMTLEDFSNKMPFTTRAEWTKDQIDNPPFGTNLTYSADCYSRFCRTSGSTGKPMIWLDTKESWSAMLDCCRISGKYAYLLFIFIWAFSWLLDGF